LSKALRIATESLENRIEYISNINKYLRDNLEKYERVEINSNEYSIPQILNFSVLGVKPETLQHALEEYDIYISTQTACSKGGEMSRAVFALTHDEKRASSSVRVSLSHLTTKEELDSFLESFKKCYDKLTELW
jgi:cysteine desulfurase